jgi:hypothetical protein
MECIWNLSTQDIAARMLAIEEHIALCKTLRKVWHTDPEVIALKKEYLQLSLAQASFKI